MPITVTSDYPHKVTQADKNRVVNLFLERGFTTHSIHGAMLPGLVEYCQKHRIPFELSYLVIDGEHGGFYLRRIDTIPHEATVPGLFMASGAAPLEEHSHDR